ncbi:MAG: prefoldin subunit beta [Nanoarchaeota archaeon]|nr:prefoldin subunit beta [Nanoarchaeota archaeon]
MKMDMDKGTQKKISKLQLLEQNMQTFLVQKQQIQSQLVEVDSALKEIESTDKAYKIIGNIMIASKKDELKDELEQKKETLGIRLRSIEKQEEKLREQSKSLQSDVLDSMRQEEKQEGGD